MIYEFFATSFAYYLTASLALVFASGLALSALLLAWPRSKRLREWVADNLADLDPPA